MNEILGSMQGILVSLGFVILGFSLRIYLERKKGIQSTCLYTKKVSPEDWSKIFIESGINNDATLKWHNLLKNEYPAIFKGLSKTIDFSVIEK